MNVAGAHVAENATVESATTPTAAEPLWDREADVVVVGFGGAGASAALEAYEAGADVLVVERFGGGGTTRLSGGVIYLGGGTRQQVQAGVEDSPGNMQDYLATEVGGVVRPETLERFCEQSVSTGEWLEHKGVPLGANLCPFKTSYPINRYTLYYSGNEAMAPYTSSATPAPRGHRTKGRGMPGGVLFRAMRGAVHRCGIPLLRRTRAVGLWADEGGRVIGVRCARTRGLRGLLHRVLDWAAYHARYGLIALPPLGRLFRWGFNLLERSATTVNIRARGGVILAAGGFIHNRQMIQDLAPAYAPATPLGALGDDGSGIALGQSVGGSTGEMDRVSAWRFINPPLAFASGLLVGPSGARLCNEALYGAVVGEKMAEEHGGRCWLIIDKELWRQAHGGLGPSRATWFQSVPALVNLYLNIRRGRDPEHLASRVGISPSGLRETLDAYNRVASSGGEDPLGKSRDLLKPLTGSLYAIDCSLGSRLFTCAALTLGGLRVDEVSGLVQRADGTSIPGVYAAGRSAVGVTSRGYVSGLSIADAVFSGRRAGRHAVDSLPREIPGVGGGSQA